MVVDSEIHDFGQHRRRTLVGVTLTIAALCAVVGTAVLSQSAQRSPVVGPTSSRMGSESMAAADVATELHAAAKLGHRQRVAKLRLLGDKAEALVGDMDAQEVATTLGEYARLGQLPDDSFHQTLLKALGTRLQHVVGQLDAQDVASTFR